MVACAIKKAENAGVKTEKLITVDLICHGPTSPIIVKEYVKMIEHKYRKKVEALSVRYKKGGKWKPPYLRIVFSDGKTHLRLFADTEYGFAFQVFSLQRCGYCKYKGDNHLSDITIGDYWGISEGDDFFNPEGVSIAIIHTPDGYNLVSHLANFTYKEVSYNQAVVGNPYYQKCRKPDQRNSKFSAELYSKGLRHACIKCMTKKELFRLVAPNVALELWQKMRKDIVRCKRPR